MTQIGEAHETVQCPGCGDWVGGNDPTCPFCRYPLWFGYNFEEEEDY